MFSEDFLEIINKTEKAYNAQNVSEIVKRAGRKEKIIFFILAAGMITTAFLSVKYFDSILNIVFSLIFAILSVGMSMYLQEVKNSENILFYENHSDLENAADYFIKNLDTEKVSPEYFELIEDYYTLSYLETKNINGSLFYFTVVLIPVIISFLCNIKGNIFMLVSGCIGILIVPGMIDFLFYAFNSKKRMAQNICKYLKYVKIIGKFNEENKNEKYE